MSTDVKASWDRRRPGEITNAGRNDVQTASSFFAAIFILMVSLALASPVGAGLEDLDDLDITLAVELELMHDRAVASHKVDVTTENGIVTLSGAVDTYDAKLQAKQAAESVKGVVAVINNLVVNPQSRPDDQIRRDVFSALAVDPVVESYEISISVNDGVVLLAGKVDSYTEKLVAQKIAQHVKGVVDVNNALAYDLATNRSDADIEADIEYRLRRDASIDSGLVHVTVTDGEVTLRGSVSSAAEKTEAASEAWAVPGVAGVTNELDVKWWLDGDRNDWTSGWTDEDMRKAVERALLDNPRVSAFHVVTIVNKGVATLTGTVDNLQAKRTAENEALDVLGIWRVKNHLRVRPTSSPKDKRIAEDIRESLRRSPYVDRYDIEINVRNAKVYLTGVVDSWFMKNRAEEVAASVSGVVDIQNRLHVDSEIASKSDREIKEDIESQLFWSPFVDSDDIIVEVHSGVATLIGNVEDWAEFVAAKENALEAGATSVICKLEVEHGGGAS
jgi:osmotically-inducible protein OsmY